MPRNLKTVVYCYLHEFMGWRRRLAGIYRFAHEAGWFVMSAEASDMRKSLRSAKTFWNADGFIVEEPLFRGSKFNWSDFNGKAAVFFGGERHDGIWRVVHDSDDAACCAMRELLGLGLKSYGYVGFRVAVPWSRSREKVFLRETAALNLRTTVFDPSAWGEATSSTDFYGPLKEWLAAIPKPCGIFAANDEMGSHVLRAANELHLAVPDAVSLIGVDNDELICENCTPPLASVSVPFEQSGWLAAELLQKQMLNPSISPETAVYGDSKVVARPSLGRLARRDAMVFRALEFIRVNACGTLDVTDVIRAMGVGRRSGELRFKATTGHSINEEILAVRLEKAKELLSDGRIPLDRIHTECGYGDGRSLRYMFRRATGMGLREWRAKHLFS